MNYNAYNLTRIERHYMTEAELTYFDRYGRYMTAVEFAHEVEKMRARRAVCRYKSCTDEQERNR